MMIKWSKFITLTLSTIILAGIGYYRCSILSLVTLLLYSYNSFIHYSTIRLNAFHDDLVLLHRVIVRNMNRVLEYDLRNRKIDDLLLFIQNSELVLEQFEVQFIVEEKVLLPKLSRECAMEFVECLQPIEYIKKQVRQLKSHIRMVLGTDELHIEDLYTLQRMFHSLKDQVELLYNKEEHVITTDVLNECYTVRQQNAIATDVTNQALKLVKHPDLYIPLLLYSMEPEERMRYSQQVPWLVKSVLVPYIWRNAYSKHLSLFTEHVRPSSA
jgi:hypothetical protein